MKFSYINGHVYIAHTREDLLTIFLRNRENEKRIFSGVTALVVNENSPRGVVKP